MGALGAGVDLALLPRFSASRFWDETRRLGATEFNAVGALIHILLKGEPRPDDRDNPIRLCYSALALPEAQHRAFEERFGLRMSVGYGLSECTYGTIWPRGQPPRYGSMGVLRQHPRLGRINQGRVVADDGSDRPDGEVGELLLRNPAVTPGYWQDADATAAALAGGFLHTGDIVRRDRDGELVAEPVEHATSVGQRHRCHVPVVEPGSLSTVVDSVVPPAVVVVPPTVRSTSAACHDACASETCSCWTLAEETGPSSDPSTVPIWSIVPAMSIVGCGTVVVPKKNG
jgi:hypothetical protein